MSHGADVICCIRAPLDDVVLGFDTVDPYITQNPFFGCVVGYIKNSHPCLIVLVLNSSVLLPMVVILCRRHAGRLVSPFDIDGTK